MNEDQCPLCGAYRPEPGEFATRCYGLAVDRRDGIDVLAFDHAPALGDFLRGKGMAKQGKGSWCNGTEHAWQADMIEG